MVAAHLLLSVGWHFRCIKMQFIIIERRLIRCLIEEDILGGSESKCQISLMRNAF